MDDARSVAVLSADFARVLGADSGFRVPDSRFSVTRFSLSRPGLAGSSDFGAKSMLRGSNGASGSIMSLMVSTSVAPFRSRAWQPRLCGLSILPGMANTSRDCDVACAAVVRVPLFNVASTTSVP